MTLGWNEAGFVTIDDRKGRQNIDPRPGTSLSTVGEDFLIVTGNDGIVELDINNHYVLLEENSYLHVRADGRSFLKKHKENLLGKNTLRLALGKLWAKIESAAGKKKEEGEEILEGNAAVGVRG